MAQQKKMLSTHDPLGSKLANMVAIDAKFSANSTQQPRYLKVLIESPFQWQGCIWWLAKQKICRQTKITSEKHLGWGIAGGLMNGTPIGKQEKWQFLVPVLLITGYQERVAVYDGSIEPLYHTVRLRMQSCCPGFVDGKYFTQSLPNCRIKISPLIGVQL
ncbi:hypothetical protein TNCV_2317841 [Trichonephila clavipes]|nr:hypothetical protein TNCV_2317841 [Trichonephila clavipes]